jgi:hypothetical protein
MRLWNGGLLYCCYSPGSIHGHVNGSWWRSLTNVETSAWIPIQFPYDYVANSVTTNTLGDGTYFALGSYVDGDYTPVDPRAAWRLG